MAATEISFEEMQAHLTDPLTRIVDSRMLEMYDSFNYTLQVLHADGSILATTTGHDSGTKSLELYKLQYRNNPRNNPALYGLLDDKAEQK